jgi:hypothetical protein
VNEEETEPMKEIKKKWNGQQNFKANGRLEGQEAVIIGAV